MGKKRLLAVAVCVAAIVGVSASGALAHGPAPPPGNPTTTNSSRLAGMPLIGKLKGVTAGGGPKAGEPGPLNCDHFFQATDRIGNGWPPPPFQP